jgi:hypothetical protein
MAMLAERVDGARRRRHPPRAPWPPRRSPRSVACSPRPPPAPMRPATSSCSASPAARCLAAAGGQWKARAATAPAWRRSCSSAANASWSRPTPAAGVPHRCQQRRPGRGPPPPARHLARSAWPGARRRGQREALRALLATGAAPPGPGGRHRGAQSADRGRPGGAARRAARGQHRHPDPALRQLRARPARSLRAPADRARAADHRRSAPSSWPPRPTSSPCERTTLIGTVAPWLLEVPGVGPGERRPSPGQLVASRPVALARPPSRPWPGSTRSPPPPGR